MMKRFHRWLCLFMMMAMSLGAGLSAQGSETDQEILGGLMQEAETTDEAPPPEFLPGEETRVKDEKAGTHGYYLVYLPKDYTPDRTWPVLFCYHGLNGKPTISPFKKILGGEHFILVGMGYYQSGREGYKHMKERDVDILKRVIRAVHRRVTIHPRRLFVGGLSKGAFYASSMLNNVPEARWAGGVLIGGGMTAPEKVKRSKSLYQMPIFIGCGKKDPHLKYAEIAHDHFKDMKSRITLEIWPNAGHVGTHPDSKAKEWMILNGPMRNAANRLAKAKVHEKTGRRGKALRLFRELAPVDPGDPICQQAGVAASAIEAKAKDQMDRAGRALANKDYVLAKQLYAEIATEYEGSTFGKEAKKRGVTLEADPAVREAIAKEKTNREAKKLEDRAVAAQKDGRYAEAIRLYEQYAWQYPQADRSKDVKKRLKKLQSDESLQKRLKDQKAASECRGWLSMADNFMKAGNSEKAKNYLNKILRQYPDTTWATKAKARMRNLD